MRVYYDRDADINLIKTKKVAVVGYGSQGHAHALNLRDSGVKNVAIALRKGSSTAAKAETAKFKVMDVAEAAKWADVIMMLTPDELQGDIYRDHLAANMKKGAALMFAHGLSMRFDDRRVVGADRRWLMSRAALAVIVLVPLLALVVLTIVPTSPRVRVGIAIMAASPVAPLALQRIAGQRGGDVPFATVMHLTLGSLAVFTTPLVLATLGAILGFRASIGPSQVAASIGSAGIAAVNRAAQSSAVSMRRAARATLAAGQVWCASGSHASAVVRMYRRPLIASDAQSSGTVAAKSAGSRRRMSASASPSARMLSSHSGMRATLAAAPGCDAFPAKSKITIGEAGCGYVAFPVLSTWPAISTSASARRCAGVRVSSGPSGFASGVSAVSKIPPASASSKPSTATMPSNIDDTYNLRRA